MKLQQFDPRVVSITDLRRDIDTLEDVLKSEEEAWVTRNQKVMFVALKPEKYKRMVGKNAKISQAVSMVSEVREKYGKDKEVSVSDYVVEMREERKKKWEKE